MEHYLALFEPDLRAGGYVITFPDFGYGVTQGETDDEAMEMAQDLLMLTIGDSIREGKQLPSPSRRRGAKFRSVPLPALQSAYQAAAASNARLKHIVLLTDGQSFDSGHDRLVESMRPYQITLSTVAIGSDADTKLLANRPRSENVCTSKRGTRLDLTAGW